MKVVPAPRFAYEWFTIVSPRPHGTIDVALQKRPTDSPWTGIKADVASLNSLPAKMGVLPYDTTGKTLRLFINRNRCPASAAKTFLFTKIGTQAHNPAIPPARGAFRDRHESWCGLRWTRGVARRAARCVRSSRVVLSPRRWGQVLSIRDFGLAAETRRSIRRRRLKSPVLRGERGVSRKAIAQGMPGCLGSPVLTCAHPSFSAHKANGCGQRPAFPAPSSFEGQRFSQKLGHLVPRQRGIALGIRRSNVIAGAARSPLPHLGRKRCATTSRVAQRRGLSAFLRAWPCARDRR